MLVNILSDKICTHPWYHEHSKIVEKVNECYNTNKQKPKMKEKVEPFNK